MMVMVMMMMMTMIIIVNFRLNYKCNIKYEYDLKTNQVTRGAFHLGKKPGNFGGSKSGISDW